MEKKLVVLMAFIGLIFASGFIVAMDSENEDFNRTYVKTPTKNEWRVRKPSNA
jgi:hypothetical protein